jgi:glycerol-3-phosphate dehydrogenase
MIGEPLERAATRRYDLAVIGGGIHGVCAALEAARRGRRVLLLEQGDFGGATSWNSFRILHGGLRYLQKMDLRRFHQSVAARRWFCQTLPELVAPLPCAFPLYGRGLKRRSTFTLALRLNDALAWQRNRDVAPRARLPRSAMLSALQTIERIEGLDKSGLQGAGLWYDAQLRSPQRAIVELLKWAAACGATALNHMRAVELQQAGTRVSGVVARDARTGRDWRFHAARVLNAAGPWARSLGRTFDPHMPGDTLGHPSLAFNALVDRSPISDLAVAAEPPGPNAQVYFLRSYGTRLFIGTGHAPWHGSAASPSVDQHNLQSMIDDVNAAIPGLQLRRDEVTQVMAGLLPAREAGGTALTDRERLYDHGRQGGPRGLFTLSGVKYTTAPLVAEAAVSRALGERARLKQPTPRPRVTATPVSLLDAADAATCTDQAIIETVRHLAQAESATSVEDILWRRTEWGLDPVHGPAVRERLTKILGAELIVPVQG